MSLPYRIGFGYDVHAFERGRRLILGGIEIPCDKGLQGHSDADVLLHSIIDSILGALALGDIGRHFPDTDEKYKNADSKVMLKEVMNIVDKTDFVIGNIDSTIVLQKPKIANYIDEMRKVVSEILNVELNQISIKATTSEQMGFVGREEGAVAFATTLLVGK